MTTATATAPAPVKKITKKEALINSFMTKEGAQKEVFFNLTIVKYGVNNIALWSGRSIKPSYHYKFKTPEMLNSWLTNQIEYEKKQVEREAKRIEEFKKEIEQIKKGSILVSRWGFEQTNVDFYIVLERKNLFVTVQEIGQHKNHNHALMTGTCTPDTTKTKGEPIRKKILNSASIKFNTYQRASLWNGKPSCYSSYA